MADDAEDSQVDLYEILHETPPAYDTPKQMAEEDPALKVEGGAYNASLFLAHYANCHFLILTVCDPDNQASDQRIAFCGTDLFVGGVRMRVNKRGVWSKRDSDYATYYKCGKDGCGVHAVLLHTYLSKLHSDVKLILLSVHRKCWFVAQGNTLAVLYIEWELMICGSRTHNMQWLVTL